MERRVPDLDDLARDFERLGERLRDLGRDESPEEARPDAIADGLRSLRRQLGGLRPPRSRGDEPGA